MSKDMPAETPDLVALVGSRICHDLVSPLGAIGNGLELMLLAGGEETPEMALVNESLVNARGRIRFFRLAFGAAEPGAVARAADIAEALTGIDTKAGIDWTIGGDMARSEAKRALLAVNCLTSAMPFGGTITVERGSGAIVVTGTADRFKIVEEDWTLLAGPGSPAPAKVHFALLRQETAIEGRNPTVQITDGTITVTA